MHANWNAKSYGAFFTAAVLGASLFGCLPADTRPEPGSLLTTVTGSPATRNGVTTVDGWALTFDRALLLVGPMQLGDECNKHAEYSEPGYERLLDVTLPDAQKLSIMHGIGSCDVDFKIGVSCEGKPDVLLGADVTEADSAFMHTPGMDPFLEPCTEDGLKPQGVALHVEGAAVQGSRSLRFVWDIRQSQFFLDCRATIDGQFEAGLTLRGGEAVTYNLLIETEALFRDDIHRETAVLRFDPFAAADATFGNDDGLITLDELDLVSLEELRATGSGPPASLGAPYSGSKGAATLGEYVYREQWWTVMRFRDTGLCRGLLIED